MYVLSSYRFCVRGTTAHTVSFRANLPVSCAFEPPSLPVCPSKTSDRRPGSKTFISAFGTVGSVVSTIGTRITPVTTLSAALGSVIRTVSLTVTVSTVTFPLSSREWWLQWLASPAPRQKPANTAAAITPTILSFSFLFMSILSIKVTPPICSCSPSSATPSGRPCRSCRR